MKKFLLALLLVTAAAPALAQDKPVVAIPVAPAAPSVAVTADERAKIESVVRDMFDREPQIVMEAAKKFQAKQQEQQQAQAANAIKDNAAKLYNDANSPVGGNPKGDVTIVEFFDYNCGYCKKVQPTVEALLAADKNVRFVYKEFPILGPTSLVASKAAVAAALQGKYIDVHNALMTSKEHFTDDAKILAVVATVKGLDVAKLKKDMEGDAVKQRLDADIELGRKVGIQGTPGFIIDSKLIPGAMDVEQLKKMVADARAALPAKK